MIGRPAGPFRGRGRGAARRVEVRLHDPERALLADLFDQTGQLLEPEQGDPGPDAPARDPLAELVGMDLEDPDRTVSPPQDPAVARLLPDASRADPDVAAEFRRLTEDGLRARKRGHLAGAAERLRSSQRPLVLDLQAAQGLLKAVTDVRLVLAQRLGLDSDEMAEQLHAAVATAARDGAEQAQPWLGQAAVYDLLTAWQEALVEALTG